MTDPRKPIFDEVKAARAGKSFSAAEITLLDGTLDQLEVPRSGPQKPTERDPDKEGGRTPEPPANAPTGLLRPSAEAIRLLHEFEGCARKRADGLIQAYPDPGSGGDPWTIGWGSTGPGIKRGTVWTQEQADRRFEEDLNRFALGVTRAIDGAKTSQLQFDALVSFAYNVGLGNLQSSTLLKKHRAGDHAGAAAEFAKWNKASGRVMPGLTRRRAAEAALYKRGS